jgi:hypothetical protein
MGVESQFHFGMEGYTPRVKKRVVRKALNRRELRARSRHFPAKSE